MENKRKGSSMITVLGVAMILMLLSGMVLKFTMGTMKSNVSQKEVEDIQFAAEGGVELARSYLYTKATPPKGADGKYPVVPESEFVIDTEIPGSAVENLTKELEKGEIKNVAVKTVSLGNDKYEITSVATATDDRKKTVKCKMDIFRANSNDIFDYGIVAGQGTVDIKNTSGSKNNLGTTTVSSSSLENNDGSNANNLPNNSDGKVTPITKNKFGNIGFLTIDKPLKEITVNYSTGTHIALSEGVFEDDKGNIIEPTIIEANINDPTKMKIDGKEKNVSDLGDIKNIPSDVKLKPVVIMNVHGFGLRGYLQLLMANTDHMVLRTNNAALDLDNVAIINGGTVEFKGTGALKFIDSTVYSKNIVADLNLSFEVIGSIKNTTSSGAFGEAKFENLNTFIEAIIPGWNDEINESQGSAEIINGSFGGE